MAMYRFDFVARNVYTIALRDELDITTILDEISLSMKGKKKEGLVNLQKAKELGYPQADELIEKYAK